MRKVGRPPRPGKGGRFAVPALLLLLLGLLVPVTAATAEESLNLPGPLSPRRLEIPGRAENVELRDSSGRAIPLTGPQVEYRDGVTVVYPPKLAEGVYELRHADGAEQVVVGEEVAVPAPTGEGSGRLLMLALAVPFAALYLLLLRRYGVLRSIPLAVVAVAFVAFSLRDGPGADVAAPDPCLAVEMAQEVQTCMFDHMQEFLVASSTAQTVDRLEKLAAIPGSVWNKGCHETAHYLGQIAWREGGSVDAFVEKGTLTCSFGYFHGLLESMGTYLSDEEFPTMARQVCEKLETFFTDNLGVGGARECAHGIGHAAMWRTNEDFTRATPICDGLALTEWREDCGSGAVMSWVFAREEARSENRLEDLPAPAVEKPLDLCAAPHGTATEGCTDGALTGTTLGEYESSVSWCASRPALAEICGRSLGRRLVYWENSSTARVAEMLPGLCSSLRTAEHDAAACAGNVSWSYMYVFRDFPRSKTLCASLPGEYYAGCRRGLVLFYEHARKRGDKSVGEPPAEILAEMTGA